MTTTNFLVCCLLSPFVYSLYMCLCLRYQGDKRAWPPGDTVGEEKRCAETTIRKDPNSTVHHEQGRSSLQRKSGGYQTPEARDQEAKTRKDLPQQDRLKCGGPQVTQGGVVSTVCHFFSMYLSTYGRMNICFCFTLHWHTKTWLRAISH